MENWIELKPFKAWFAQTIPTMFNDELSYYETLCRVIYLLNSTMANVNTLKGEYEKFTDKINETVKTLTDYMNNYFDNLDVQEEINKKLDELVEDGTIPSLIQPLVGTEVDKWLKANLTPTNPPLDSTLSMENAAAQAKATGELLRPAKVSIPDDSSLDQVDFNFIYSVLNNPNFPPTTGLLIALNYIMTSLNFQCQIGISKDQFVYRCYLNNSWGPWQSLVTIDNSLTSSTQAPPASAVYGVFNMSKNIINGQNVNDINPNSIVAVENPVNFPETYATIMTFGYNKNITNYKCQIGITPNNIYFRSYFINKWGEWQKILTELNLGNLMQVLTEDVTDYNFQENKIVHNSSKAETIFTAKPSLTNNFTMQFRQNQNNDLFFRYFANNKYNLWSRVSKTTFPFYNTTLVLGGDSITQGYGGTGFEQDGETIITVDGRTWKRNTKGLCWARALKIALNEQFCNVINNGCTGTNWQFWGEHISELLPPCRYFLLTLGTNNTGESFNVAQQSISQNLDIIAQYCENNSINLIVSTIPFASKTEEQKMVTKTARISSIIEQECDKRKIPCIPLHIALTEYYFTKGQLEGGSFSDGLHPDDQMYQVMFYQYCKLLNISIDNGKYFGNTPA